MQNVYEFAPAILLGGLIGLYEAIIIHRDVKVRFHRFGHSIHALLLSTFFVFCTTNAATILKLAPLFGNMPLLGTTLGFQILIGIIAAIRIHAVSRATNLINIGGTGETWFHSIIIGISIIVLPRAYALIGSLLPKGIF